MYAVINDAAIPADELRVDGYVWGRLYLAMHTGHGRESVVALDVEGAETLARVLVDFLRKNAEPTDPATPGDLRGLRGGRPKVTLGDLPLDPAGRLPWDRTP